MFPIFDFMVSIKKLSLYIRYTVVILDIYLQTVPRTVITQFNNYHVLWLI